MYYVHVHVRDIENVCESSEWIISTSLLQWYLCSVQYDTCQDVTIVELVRHGKRDWWSGQLLWQGRLEGGGRGREGRVRGETVREGLQMHFKPTKVTKCTRKHKISDV